MVSILTKGKQPIGSSSNFSRCTNFLNIDHLYEIINKNEIFDIWYNREHIKKAHLVFSTMTCDLL